ncbi:MAG: T9SS type A sorting domain-containing protein, partial [Candidatus Cloacimonetes bacterium]|nr:T9SS type A sorting domain-containing protein [Candidatus Cloacimonadota bacterium]
IETNFIQNNLISSSNFPNPFNPSTTIEFSIEQNQQNEQVKLVIYNIKGEKVRELPIVTPSPSHTFSVTWNGTDDYNKPVSSGVYFYKMKAGEYNSIKKMMLLK